MIIEKIDIKCFGRLQNLSLEFGSGVNVIEGSNESGKSTIAGFIKYMLYGFDAVEEPRRLGERRLRINWQSGIAEGSMNVTVKGKRYLITRSTVMNEGGGRTTYKEESSIIDLESGTPAFGKRPAGEVFFGVGKELFENTAFLGQVGDAAFKAGSVKDAIENILFSGSEKINTQRAIGKISDKMESLYHKGNTGGAIFDLVKRQEELEARLHSIDEANKQILAKEAELHEIRARQREAESRRERLLDLDECYRNVMLIQTFDKLHELEEESDRAAEEYNSFIAENTVSGFVPSPDYLTDIALARRGVDEAYNRTKEAEEAYSTQKNAIGITREIEAAIALSDTLGGEEKIKERAGVLRRGRLLGLFGIIGSALAAIAGLVAIFAAPLNTALTVVIGIAAAAFLGLGGYFGYRFYRDITEEAGLAKTFACENAAELLAKLQVIGEARKKRDTLISNLEAAKEALERAKGDTDAARSELIRVAMLWGTNPPASDLSGHLDRLEERVREFLEKSSALREKKTDMEITVREIRRTLADKSEIDIRAQVPPLKRKVLAEINYDEIITGIADARATVDEQQKLSFGVEGDLSALKLRAGDPGEIYSKIQALDTKIDELRAKHKAYYVALSAISSASDNLRAEISPRLEEYAKNMLSVMTAGKYTELGINEALNVSFTTGEVKGKSVDYLSGGTRDLTYIAVRMALMDMLYSEKPPVCFDETFANQDNDRAEAMMRAIARLAEEGHQSFIFTCRAREGVLAGELAPGAGVYKLSVTEA